MKQTSFTFLALALVSTAAIFFALRTGDSEPEAVRPSSAIGSTTESALGPDRFADSAPGDPAAAVVDRAAVELEKAAPSAEERVARFVVVRVVDARGDGVADCPIRVGCEGGAAREGNTMVQRTDREGRYRFPEVTFEQTFGEIAPDARFVFDVALALRERANARASWSELFEREIVLRAPALGAIELDVTRSGAPLADPATLELEVTYESAPSLPNESPRIGDRRLSAPIEAGRARVAPVPLGLRFWPDVRLATGVVSQAEPLTGPIADGEVVRARIDLEASPYLTFRVIDGTGAAVANEPIEVTRFELDPQGPSYGVSGAIESDAEGRCIVSWPAPFAAGVTRRLTVAIGANSRRGADEAKRAGSVVREFHEPFAQGRNDLGELRLVPVPSLVSGIVVDEDGAPIDGAHVYLDLGEGAGAGDHTTHRSRETGTRTDAAGRFEFFGEPTGDSPRVRAAGAGYENGRFEPFAPGAADLVLVLERGSRVRGGVILPSFLPPSDVRARLARSDEQGGEPSSAQSVQPDAEGAFEFAGVSAGRYEFALDAGPLERAIVVPDVVVPPRAEVADPRLSELSLAALLREIAVVVKDRDGAAIAGARVAVERGAPRFDPGTIRTSSTDEQGRATLVIASAGQTVIASADGFRPAWREHCRGDVEFALAKSLSVTLRARGDTPLERGSRTLAAALAPVSGAVVDAGARAGLDPYASHPFSSAREARLIVAFPGRYRVVWLRTESAPNVSMSMSLGGTQEIELYDTSSMQLVEVDPPANALDDR